MREGAWGSWTYEVNLQKSQLFIRGMEIFRYYLIIIAMQDASSLPEWDPKAVLKAIGENRLDQRALKIKLDKIYMINTYNEQEYLPDLFEVYGWVRFATQFPLNQIIASERVEKYFLEEFISTAIKDMILCKRFKNNIMMILTQQLMVEALKVFVKYFPVVEKYPKITSILKFIFDQQKQFYRLNYPNQFHYLTVQPTQQEIQERDKFIDQQLQVNDKVDVLKTELHSRRVCWLPGLVKRLSHINIYVTVENEKHTVSFDRKAMQVAPFGTMKSHYEWRFALKEGDLVDFQDAHGQWHQCKITEIRDIQCEEVPGKTIRQVGLIVSSKAAESSESTTEQLIEVQRVSLTDPRIQKRGSIITEKEEAQKANYSQLYIDDFNDVLFDPEMKFMAISRYETVKSLLYTDLMNYAHKELNMFEMIAAAVESRRFGIEVTADLVTYIYMVHTSFHRKFALDYLNRFANSILDYINKMDQMAIRNFSKERYQHINVSLTQFLKRLKSGSDRKRIIQDFQLDLILRFLFSDFLDKKLQAVTMLTTFLKMAKHSLTLKTDKELDLWVRQNKILPAIYNQKSHSELINRSTDFMQYYLLTKPPIEDLNPLLEWNQSIIKLVNQIFDYFPEEFQANVVNKIKERANVENKDALNIVKKTNGCETWLLKNGGESWVDVVREKSKRKADIAQVFQQDFKVVMKITKEISNLYQCRFRTQFFIYINEINYLSTVLGWEHLDIKSKLDFANLTLEPIGKISDDTFHAILPLTTDMNDSLPPEYQEFFVSLLPKLGKKHFKQLFEKNFQAEQNLRNMGEGQFNLFKKAFISLNQQGGNIDRRFVYKCSPHSYRKEKQVVQQICVNPNQLIGMPQLMTIIFENKNLDVTERALKLIGYLFDHLAANLADSAVQFKANFLNTCLQKFYSTTDQQEKYLKIIDKLMNESEKEGVDQQPSVAALFPQQFISIKIIDHFNVNKSKFLLTTPSNNTLHQVRGQIARAINAYVHQMKIIVDGKELDPRLNGNVIRTLQFNDDLIIEKKGSIDKIPLTESDGTLTEKAKIVFKDMFREYSTLGLMSKQQCSKYHQRCVGQVSSASETRVEKIYEQYDTDKDGYLTEEDFLKFYENAARGRESAVWSNLETFGVRNDLEILNNLDLKYPEPDTLTRTLLFKDQKFLEKVFSLMQSDNDEVAAAAWKIANRLPLAKHTKRQFNIEKKYSLRYWLYLVEARNELDKISGEILKRTMESDVQTMCIGLKVCENSSQLDIEIFRKLMQNLGVVNKADELTFINKVVLDYSLKIIKECLNKNDQLREQYLGHIDEYAPIISSGLMSPNAEVRTMYCDCISTIMEESTQKQWPVFEAFFNLVFKNFQSADKSTFHIEYFDLFSKLLETLKENSSFMEKLKLNWKILTVSMIKQYQEHRCREENLNSPPDQVAQGFLRIITKLLDKQTMGDFKQLVNFIFTKSLFPESGLNKLKNPKSRKDAYELIYEICKMKNEKGQSEGLKELFDAGFKKVYKKMSQTKNTYSFSYFYSYNEARSELGYAGIRNLGCVCYMISMLQQLYMTPAFRYLTLMADDGEPECLTKKGNKEIDDNLFHQLQALFANLQLTERQEFNPEELCFAFKDFEGNPLNVSIQQDAQQFLNIFFDKIENCIKTSPFKHILENIFGGKTCSRTVCSNCKAIKERQETFYPLSLQIKGYKDIHDSFRKYIQGEVISDYQCDFCNKKTDVTKSTYIAKTPDHFIVHLQRMCFNYDKFENEKVNARWQFPHDLNIYDYSLAKQKGIPEMPGQFQYKLRGVVVHYGSADFGHYFSYIRQTDKKWIQFNDERVRELDPRDIEAQCFGGQHWRRESQNAYLLVYQRVQLSDIVLEFDTVEQKDQILKKYRLFEKAPPQRPITNKEGQTPQREKQTETQQDQKETMTEKSDQKTQKSEEKSQKGQNEAQKKEQPKKILAYIDPSKIQPFIPENLATKINKANEQFSFSINLSNDQFAYFIYRVLSIDPPAELTTQYLQLCYECFHLKQIVNESEGVTLSEWATRRFKEIIKGYGWEFLKNFGQNWENDIISSQKSTRVGMKNLLECVISDIIQSNRLNEEQEQTTLESEEQGLKREIVIGFLDKYMEMMHDEVAKHWPRFKDYFDVWCYLVDNNRFVRRYCEEKMMVERLLDFVMEDDSTISANHKRHSMGNQYYPADFEHPLDVITLLIKHGYELNDMEKKCMRSYAFMNKIINFPTQHFNLINFICQNNPSMSERFAYLLLSSCAKVTQSDGVKPIISAVLQFVSIEDELKKRRVEWILGFPQYLEQPRTGSYGTYGISPEHEAIVHFISPVGNVPALQQLLKFKPKSSHISILLVGMLLQLEADGYVHNLDQFPSAHSLHFSYTYWFGQFVDSYYEDTRQPYTGKNYTDYANRAKNLWTHRPNRAFGNPAKIMVGKTNEKQNVSETIIDQTIVVTQLNVQSSIVIIPENYPPLTVKGMKKLQNTQNFMPKPASSYGISSFVPIGRYKQSSDEEEQSNQEGLPNPFDNATNTNVFRKIILKNLSMENMLVVVKLIPGEDCNLVLPISELSIDIRAESCYPVTLIKADLEKDYGNLQIEVKILGKSTRSGFWPRQIITELDVRIEEDDKGSSDEDSGDTYP